MYRRRAGRYSVLNRWRASAIVSTATLLFVNRTVVPPCSHDPHFSKSSRASDGTKAGGSMSAEISFSRRS